MTLREVLEIITIIYKQFTPITGKFIKNFIEMVMKENNSEIEELEKSLDEMRGMWMNALNETEALKQELELYKKLCRVQAEVIHR